MRAVFGDLRCSPHAAKAMVEDQGIDTLDDLCFLKVKHCARISNVQEVQLGETTGEPTWDIWSDKKLKQI